MERFVDEGYSLLQWADRIDVLCPKCNSHSMVIKGRDKSPTSFYCESCFHTMSSSSENWKGPVLGIGRKRCNDCGYKWVIVEKEYKDISAVKSPEEPKTCEQCSAVNIIHLKFVRSKPLDNGIDPYFGLDLWFKSSCRYGSIWCYNREHLSVLKSYVSAQLRENSWCKWSYFTRLPKWIKASKNRETVLKTISQLENKKIN